MASGMTNKGKKNLLGYVFHGDTLPTKFYLALVTSAVTPNADTNTLDELTQIAVGNGYTTGGYELSPGGTDFPTLTEDDTNDKGILGIKEIIWTASGGNIPSSGNGARWAILTDDNATEGSRNVLGWYDLSADRTISNTQQLKISGCGINLT